MPETLFWSFVQQIDLFECQKKALMDYLKRNLQDYDENFEFY